MTPAPSTIMLCGARRELAADHLDLAPDDSPGHWPWAACASYHAAVARLSQNPDIARTSGRRPGSVLARWPLWVVALCAFLAALALAAGALVAVLGWLGLLS